MSYVVIERREIEDSGIALAQKWIDTEKGADDYLVGFFLPNGLFFVDFVETDYEGACVFCHFMNGGSRDDMPV